MGRTVSLTEAKAKLNELVRDAQEDNIVLVRHGQAAAVIVSPEHYEGLREEIEDLKDRLALLDSEPSDLNIPLKALRSELAMRGATYGPSDLAAALSGATTIMPDVSEWATKLAPSFAALQISAPAAEVLAAITAAASDSVIAFLRQALSDLSERSGSTASPDAREPAATKRSGRAGPR